MRPGRLEVGQIALPGGVQHVKASAGECLDGGVVDRPGALRAAEHEYACLARRDPEPRACGGPVLSGRRDRAAGNAVLAAVSTVERERQADTPAPPAPAADWSARGGCRPRSARAARVRARPQARPAPPRSRQPPSQPPGAACAAVHAQRRAPRRRRPPPWRRAPGGAGAAARRAVCAARSRPPGPARARRAHRR